VDATAGNKAVINLTTGGEDAETVTLAFLTGVGALAGGRQVTTFLTREAVRLAQAGNAETIEWAGGPPMSKLFEQYREGGGKLFACTICFNARELDEGSLVENAELAGTTPLWEWIGAGATVFSY
jgi:predicted peroxiredoxin